MLGYDWVSFTSTFILQRKALIWIQDGVQVLLQTTSDEDFLVTGISGPKEVQQQLHFSVSGISLKLK